MGLGLLATILGYQFAELVPAAARIYLQGVFVVLIFSVIILDTEPGWNLILLFCLGMTAGMILVWSGGNLFQLKSWSVFSILFSVSVAGGILIEGKGNRLAGALFFCALLYMIGWMLFAFVTLPDQSVMIWNALGLALFTLMLMAAIREGIRRNDEINAVPLSIQLFMVIYYLCWLSSLL